MCQHDLDAEEMNAKWKARHTNEAKKRNFTIIVQTFFSTLLLLEIKLGIQI